MATTKKGTIIYPDIWNHSYRAKEANHHGGYSLGTTVNWWYVSHHFENMLKKGLLKKGMPKPPGSDKASNYTDFVACIEKFSNELWANQPTWGDGLRHKWDKKYTDLAMYSIWPQFQMLRTHNYKYNANAKPLHEQWMTVFRVKDVEVWYMREVACNTGCKNRNSHYNEWAEYIWDPSKLQWWLCSSDYNQDTQVLNAIADQTKLIYHYNKLRREACKAIGVDKKQEVKDERELKAIKRRMECINEISKAIANLELAKERLTKKTYNNENHYETFMRARGQLKDISQDMGYVARTKTGK